MWECTILHKSFQSAPAVAPKKEQDKDDKNDKKDHDGFQQQQNIIVGAYQCHLAMTPADADLGRQYFMNHE